MSLVVDPLQPERLYIGAAKSGVFRRQPAASTWEPLNERLLLSLYFGGAIALDARSRVLYAATPAGIYRLARPED